MLEQYLDQINDIMRMHGDADGIIVANRDGILEYGSSRTPLYLLRGEVIGCHILDLYPGLTEEDSTVMRVLKTGRPIYHERQELVNRNRQRVILEATTIPIVVDGRVEGAVDTTKFYTINQREVRGGAADGRPVLERIVTQNPAMESLKGRIRDVADLNSSVLIFGETGTGKELVAEALHSEGQRAKGPFVAQNCAAIPANLLESIFFGTERGSYTGAVDRKGLFELADGGTLFLDEINSMDIQLQTKLLKALEEKKVRKVGGHEDISFDVRIVAATNEEPRQALREGHIRQDLYYRLGVIRLTLPPLRERPEDIPLLTRYFIGKYNWGWGRNIEGVSPAVEDLFQQYRWPGNIRELQNTIEGAFATAQSNILQIEDIEDVLKEEGIQPRPEAAAMEERIPAVGFSLSKALEDYERTLILRAIQEEPSISKAALRLGVSRQNLKYKLKKYQLQKFFPV